MNLLTKLKLRMHKHFGYEFFARSAYGMDIVAIYDFTGKISLNGSHSKVIENAVNELQPGDCFIDVGANTGIFSLIASRRVGSNGMVFSFEPNPEVFRVLQKNLIHNKSQNVFPFCAGVSDTDGVISFVYDPHHNGLGHIKADSNYQWDRANQKETRILTLGPDSLTFLNEGSCPGKQCIIKIDTEGAELKVLQGLTHFISTRKPNKIIVEISSDHLNRFGHSMKQVYDHMQSIQYRPVIKESLSQNSESSESNEHYDEIFVPA